MVHTGDRPYECDVCKKRFQHSGNLKKHKRTHTGDKPYECDVCKKKFVESGHLKIHKRTHTKEKPYECDVCKKRFAYRNSLVIHRRLHTGDRPYECGICMKKFKHSSSLVIHSRRHTGETPYECDVCKKTFSRNKYLKYHEKQHLLCHSCHKEIILPQDLQEHSVEDTNIRKYACSKCGKRFSVFLKLVQHIARHHRNDGDYQCGLCQELEATGVGYVCFVCDVVFDVPRELENHMVTH